MIEASNRNCMHTHTAVTGSKENSLSRCLSSSDSEQLPNLQTRTSGTEGESETTDVSSSLPTSVDGITDTFTSPLPTPIENSQSIETVQVPVLPVAPNVVAESRPDSKDVPVSDETDEVSGGSKEAISSEVANQLYSGESNLPGNSSTCDPLVTGGDKEDVHGVQVKLGWRGQATCDTGSEVAEVLKPTESVTIKNKERQQRENEQILSSCKNPLNSDDSSDDDDWDESLLPPPRYSAITK